jgi:hypothetical protein
VANTTASRIQNARRKYIGAFVVSVNDVAVFTAASILDALRAAATSDDPSFKIVFAPDRYIPVADRHLDQPLRLTVDQLRTVSVITSSSPVPASFVDDIFFPDSAAEFDDDHAQLLIRSLNTTTHGTTEEQGLGSFTRRKLRRLPNWRDGRTPSISSSIPWQNRKCMVILCMLPETRSFFANTGTMLSKAMALAKLGTVVTVPLVRLRS